MNPEESLVTPRHYLSYLRERGVPPQALEVAPSVLLGWGGLSRRLAATAGARRRRHWPYDAEWPYYDAGDLGIASLPTGAPAAAFLLDQLVAAGARSLVTIGIGGSLVPTIPPGTILVIDEAIAGDGTSRHYAPTEDQPIPASPALAQLVADAVTAAGAEARIGSAWTTDAPFREVPATLAAAREQGAVAVEMEAAAVYALAAHRGIDACSVLVVSDGVWDEWRPAFGAPSVTQALNLLCRVLPEALSSSSATTFSTAST